jgi:hypothetical protein
MMRTYNLQFVDSLPQPRREQHSQAFVTGGAYALLFLFGAMQGLVGCFQYSRSAGPIPVAALILAALILVTCILGAIGMGSAAGALLPAAGWLLVSVVLTLPTPGGSVIVTNTAAGAWYLYGGSVCAAAGVVYAFVSRSQSRSRARMRRS